MITLYTGTGCSACEAAKSLLKANSIEYHEADTDNNLNARQFLIDRGIRSIPQLFKDEQHIGTGLEGVRIYIKGLE